jgi:hypothetical protein
MTGNTEVNQAVYVVVITIGFVWVSVVQVPTAKPGPTIATAPIRALTYQLIHLARWANELLRALTTHAHMLTDLRVS